MSSCIQNRNCQLIPVRYSLNVFVSESFWSLRSSLEAICGRREGPNGANETRRHHTHRQTKTNSKKTNPSLDLSNASYRTAPVDTSTEVSCESDNSQIFEEATDHPALIPENQQMAMVQLSSTHRHSLAEKRNQRKCSDTRETDREKSYYFFGNSL